MTTILLPNWVLVGFFAVILWVAGSFFDKYLLNRYFDDEESQIDGPGALIIFSSYFSIAIVITILVLRYESISFDLIPGLFGVSVGVINGLWILIYLYALNMSEVSRVVPIFQTIPIFGLILGFFLLGEHLTLNQIYAASIVIFGALVLLHDKQHSFFGVDVKTLLLMLFASSLIALTEVFFKIISIGASYWTAAFWTSVGFTLFGVFLYFTVRRYREEFLHMFLSRVKHVLGSNSVNEIMDNGAELIFFFAVTIGPIALVQSLNAYQPIIVLAAGIVLGTVFPKYFREDFSRSTFIQKMFGVLIMMFGSIYLYTLI